MTIFSFITAWVLIIFVWIVAIWQRCAINNLERKLKDMRIDIVALERKIDTTKVSVTYIYDALHAEMDKNVEKI